MCALENPKGAGSDALAGLGDTANAAWDTITNPKATYEDIQKQIDEFSKLSKEDQARQFGAFLTNFSPNRRLELLAPDGKGNHGGGIDGNGGDNKIEVGLSPELSKKIEKALRSSDEGVRLEGELASALGDNVIGFQKKIDVPGQPRVGEIDVETDKYIIEVTMGKSSKTASEFDKYFIEPINPDGKQVILFAPNLKETKLPDIQAKGVIVVKDLDELKKLVGGE